MEASVGKALRDARLQKQLTLEEAARATKMRRDRISDLERDDYTRFPNLAYARSFLLLYAKYLGVDLSRFETVEIGSPAGVRDYQYLQNEKGVDSLRFSHQSTRPPRKPRWILAALVLLSGLALGAVAALVILNVLRLPSIDQLLKKHESGDLVAPAPLPEPAISPQSSAAAGNEAPAPEVPAQAGVAPLPSGPLAEETPAFQEMPFGEGGLLAPEVRKAEPLLSGSAPETAPAPEPTEESNAAADRALLNAPATPESPAGSPAPTATPTPSGPLHEVKIRVTKKTRVKIFQDDVDSPPIYDDWLTPGKPGLTFKGRKFWVKTRSPRDREALVVTSDGKPVEGSRHPVVGVQLEQP